MKTNSGSIVVEHFTTDGNSKNRTLNLEIMSQVFVVPVYYDLWP
jgi:hypothetical protein